MTRTSTVPSRGGCGAPAAWLLAMLLLLPAGAHAAGSQSAASVAGSQIPMALVEERLRADDANLRARHAAQVRRLDVQLSKARTALLERTVDALVDERLLELEATATGSTPQALLAKLPQPTVGDDEVRDFYVANATRLQRPLADVESEIRTLLATRAAEPERRRYLDELRRKHGVRLSYEVTRYDVDAASPGHVRGPPGAPVTIVEFADFQCPYCAGLVPTLSRIVAEYPDRVRHVFRHNPLRSIHPQAYGAAVAAVCAAEQQKFWPMYEAMMADQDELGPDGLVAIAGTLGLDGERFARCMDGATARAAVDRDLAAVGSLPIEGTPAVFVNGRVFLGALNYESLRRVVEEELGRAGVAAAPVARAAAR